jgi:hypothetical protein
MPGIRGLQVRKLDYVKKGAGPMNAGFTPRNVAGLRERLSGRVVLPGQEDYDATRQVWNASHDHRPALIAQPVSAADVQAALRAPSPATGGCRSLSGAAGTTMPATPSRTAR